MQRGDLERLAAADVGALQLVIAPDHIGLGLGEPGPVALIGSARKLAALAPYDPGDLILPRLAAFRTGQVVRALLRCLVKKLTFIHRRADLQLSHLV